MKLNRLSVFALVLAAALLLLPKRVTTQTAAMLFGNFGGAATAVTTTTNGYLNVAVAGGFTSTTATSNVGVAETDLISYPLPANTLSVNGQKVRVTAWGSFAANVNTKTIRAYFGATVVTNIGAGGANANGRNWKVTWTVVRSGAAIQVAEGTLVIAGTDGSLNFTNQAVASPTETLSGAVTIKMTGQSGTASADITQLGMFVEVL